LTGLGSSSHHLKSILWSLFLILDEGLDSAHRGLRNDTDIVEETEIEIMGQDDKARKADEEGSNNSLHARNGNDLLKKQLRQMIFRDQSSCEDETQASCSVEEYGTKVHDHDQF
jgi:hypothetical protein